MSNPRSANHWPNQPTSEMLPLLPWKKTTVAALGCIALSKNQPFRRYPSAVVNHTFAPPGGGVNCSFAATRTGWKVVNHSNQRNPYTNATRPNMSEIVSAIDRSRLSIDLYKRSPTRHVPEMRLSAAD